MTTDEELRDTAFLALHNALGAADGLRFMRFYRPEPGDFTEEKYLYLGNPSLDEFLDRVEAARTGTGLHAPAATQRSDAAVMQAGFQALKEALGVQESLRFIRLYTGPDPAVEREFLESCGREIAGRGAA